MDADINKTDPLRLVTGFGAWRIGDILVSDGPHGIRAQEDGDRNNDSYEATCFPTASSIACSWNTDMIGKMARGIASEAKELGISVVLGPGINMKRSPLCGRNFEYFSEDPFLAGTLASAYISSMQDCGVGTSLKHFACNNQETHRMTQNSMVDERALHEIYLTAFEIAVRNASPATIMASYNYINGVPACEDQYLLTDVLRNRWGYRGLVMSDWGACVDLPASIDAGMDVEMPDSNGSHYPELKDALEKNILSEDKLTEAVSRVKALCAKYSGIKAEPARFRKISEETRKAGHLLARQMEEESAVLLKNDGFLPLKDATEILVIGELAVRPRIQGGGSSHIHTETVDIPVEELEKCGLKVRFARGYNSGNFRRSRRLEKEALSEVRNAKERGIPVLFFGGLTDMAEGEGFDRESFGMPSNQEYLLREVLEINSDTGFISFGGSPYDMTVPDRCRAVLQLYLGGEAAGSAAARIITGLVNPSGKLAETIGFSEKDAPSYGYFGRQEGQKLHPDDVEYRESIFTGYRYYDTFDRPVRYCFGHGLSYTQFAYSDLKITMTGNASCTVSFMLENTGDVTGSEVCQVYVKNPAGDDFRACRELRGFAKICLEPGERRIVEIALSDRAFSVYQDNDFRVIGGRYEIQVGASLDDIRLGDSVMIEGEPIKCPLAKKNGIPLSDADFGMLYKGERTHFSDVSPGGFTRHNSLAQMEKHSGLARRWVLIGKAAVRLMFLNRRADDPEVRMMREGLLEGNIDSVSNQSGGLLGRKTVEAIIASANRR